MLLLMVPSETWKTREKEVVGLCRSGQGWQHKALSHGSTMSVVFMSFACLEDMKPKVMSHKAAREEPIMSID
jgi:hypothetical protein